MGQFEGKVVFVTGAGGGIGRATAKMFAQEGASIAVAELKPEVGEATEATIVQAGGRAAFIATDVTRDESVRAATGTALDRFGRIDILVNCAGGSVAEDDVATEVDLSVWEHTINLDLKGTFLACRNVIPHIVASGGGAVVNFTSWLGLMGAPFRNVYSTAKGGVITMPKALASEFAAKRVRVNAIAPGVVHTERTMRKNADTFNENPPPRIVYRRRLAERYPLSIGYPEDIANIVLFLASDKSRMITGAVIPADGGRSAYL
jgi:NAD(P)-dependent dehydrogenase (short-subunit alcohol dehydrogenase family)